MIPKVPRVTDGRRRVPQATRAIVLPRCTASSGRWRTRSSASPPSVRAERYARYQASTKREVSWHLHRRHRRTIVQSADVAVTCWHATVRQRMDGRSSSVQEADGTLPSAAAVVVALCDLLCARLGSSGGYPPALASRSSGWCRDSPATMGLGQGSGHRHQTRNRGPGDPGDHPSSRPRGRVRGGRAVIHAAAELPPLALLLAMWVHGAVVGAVSSPRVRRPPMGRAVRRALARWLDALFAWAIRGWWP